MNLTSCTGIDAVVKGLAASVTSLSHRAPTQLKDFTDVAMEAARAAGKVLTDYFLGKWPNRREFKARNDLVTTADLHSCRVIKRKLQSAFPTHSFLFEEPAYSQDNGSDYRWIVDPLDGTTFHNKGLPFYSVIIALEERSKIRLGVAYYPLSNDLFIAWQNAGSFRQNNRHRILSKLRVSSTKSLDEAVIGYSHGKSEAHLHGMSRILPQLLPSSRSVTRLGGAEIGYVAAGACDAFLDNSSTPWDFAAIALIVREAGGKVTDFSGREWGVGSSSIVASNGRLHGQILDKLHRATPSRSSR